MQTWNETQQVLSIPCYVFIAFILLTKTTAAQNKVALTYYRVRGLYFLAVVFVRSIVHIMPLVGST